MLSMRRWPAQPPNRRNLLVFVHGFNTSFDGSVIHLAQFVHDVEYPGVVVLFTWPSRGNAFNYVFDLNSALYSRDALMETFRLLSQTRAKHGDIMAHSMGNMLTVETLRQMELIEPSTTRNVDRRVRSIVFAAPDIDVDLFVQQIGVLPTHQYDFYMLIARDDQALSLSEFIAGGVQRAGAAELDRLRDLGIEIVDLTNVNDGSKAHSRFSRSSVIIQAVRDGTNADGSFNRSIPAPEGVTVLEAAGRVPGRLLRTVTGQPPAQ